MNHIDSGSLRYPENIHIWREKYRNDQRYWLETAVRPDLLDWGFNSAGWVQEVVTRGPSLHRPAGMEIFQGVPLRRRKLPYRPRLSRSGYGGRRAPGLL